MLIFYEISIFSLNSHHKKHLENVIITLIKIKKYLIENMKQNFPH